MYCPHSSDIPGAPTDLKATEVRVETITIAWKPPASDGGSRIKAYIIERRDAQCNYWVNVGSVDGAKTHYPVPNLTVGCNYYFRVYAENDMGVSEPCTMFSPVLAAHDQYGKGVITARVCVSFLHLVMSARCQFVSSTILLQYSATTLVFLVFYALVIQMLVMIDGSFVSLLDYLYNQLEVGQMAYHTLMFLVINIIIPFEYPVAMSFYIST